MAGVILVRQRPGSAKRDATEDRDAVPVLLPMPDRMIAEVANGLLREALVWRLQLLQADHVCLGSSSQRSSTTSPR